MSIPPCTVRREAGDSRRGISVDELVVSGRSDVAILLDDLSPDEMLLDNAARARVIDVRIPYVFRVNHDHRAVPALIHAAGMIDPHVSGETLGGCGFLEDCVDADRAVERARFAARADEDVILVLSHAGKMGMSCAG